jgi:hypothetical protein
MNNQRLHGDQPGTHTKCYSENKRQSEPRQGKSSKKPHEVRPDWAIAYPSHKTPDAWYGVVRLSLTGELYGLLISRYRDKPADLGCYTLKVSPKDEPRSKPATAQLLPLANTDRFLGILIVESQKFRVGLGQDGPYLRLHFERRAAQ